MNILIAEDDDSSRALLKKSLTEMGHRVVASTTGAEAWTSFACNPSQVVVSDWQMPDGDGLDFCRRIRKASSEHYTYFILLTGVKPTTENLLQASDAGVDDFLSKPLNPEQIWMRLRVAERILRAARQVRQLESLLPVCAYCKKIRKESDIWQQIEEYFASRTGADFSHSICPDCYQSHVAPELEAMREKNRAEAARARKRS
ncbi:MAG: response regulator [Puniceicoccaceae bacterium]|nr:MAG: response regulator [Puniceicoccaceae bacterium]